MSSKIVVPELGESILEATVGRWLKNAGDPVAVGEPVVELETEKVDLEVGAEKGGILARVEKKQGEDVKVGDVLGVIEESAGAATSPAASPSVPARADRGDQRVVSIGSRAGSKSDTGPRASAPSAETAPRAPEARSVRPETPATGGAATPSARRLAREHGIDLVSVPGRDLSGRVTPDDFESYAEATGSGSSGQAPETTEPRGSPSESGPALGSFELGAAGLGSSRPPAEAASAVKPQIGEAQPAKASPEDRPEDRVRMSRRRQTIARRLVEAQHAAAMLTTFNEVDMTSVAGLRKRHQEAFERKHGVRLGIMPFFVKAVIGALREFPELNAELQGDEIVLKRYYDIGIAVGASGGLVVPVLRDAERLSFAGIERAIRGFAEKAESGGLTLEDLRGGTFTITNGGVFGSLMSTPILNPPQVGILGMHKIQERPVTLEGQMVSRPMMYVALSYDHRVVDGREAVQFLVRVKSLIEDPGILLVEG